MASLPPALASKGHSISVVLPLYRSLKEKCKNLTRSELTLSVLTFFGNVKCPVWQAELAEGVVLFAIEKDEFFDRSHLYGNSEGDYDDNLQRFSFFSRAIVELAKYIEPQIDIIHVHDWHTALVPAYVHAFGLPFRTVLTLHNLSYQGVFPGHLFEQMELPTKYFSPQGIEYFQHINCLKGGILLAHELTTVSPTYAEEIQTETYGCGLHNILRSYHGKLTGILNGIDREAWDSSKDSFIAKNYSLRSLAGKQECKEDLLAYLKVKEKSDAPLFGFIARLVPQKGVDLLLSAMEDLLKRDLQLVIVGNGVSSYEEALKKWAKKYPNKLQVKIAFDETLAHKMYAGCDFMLVPSIFEPCGLSQLYSLRYGTIPIVHKTGGLADSIEPWDGIEGTGFVFSTYGQEAFLEQIDLAFKCKKNAKNWLTLRKNAMKQDFTWNNRVNDYESVYKNALSR